MQRYFNCMVHSASEGSLLIGDEKTAMIDCGMAFCAAQTIRKAKDALGDRPLDYLCISHTHYDHIGALPAFRKEWPQVLLVASEVGAAVLLRTTPRQVIREFSLAAGKQFHSPYDAVYSDEVFRADRIMGDGESLSLGGISIEALATPGHTKDSVCHRIPELGLLMLNETPGVLLPDGSMYPCYLSGYADTIASIEKCRRVSFRQLSLPHRGIVEDLDAKDFFDMALETNHNCRDFVLHMRENELDEGAMLEAFHWKYSNETLFRYQPKEAFFANARATIACTLRES